MNFFFSNLKVIFKKKIKVKVLHSGIQYTQKTFGSILFLYLDTFYIEDYFQPWGNEFRYLASSIVKTKMDQTESEIGKSIIQIYYSTDEEQSLALHFNRLHLISNSKTIIKLTELANTIMNELK